MKVRNIDMAIKAKPFLRWAGGKKWLLSKINELTTNLDYNRYHEPFLGGGSIFFHLQPAKPYISDSNSKLIDTYKAVKARPKEVIRYIKQFKRSKEDYYYIRNQKFRSETRKAAQFIYLNQMSFNGIYRVNMKGEYNVPYGYRDKYKFDYENIIAVSKSLRNVKLKAQDFEKALKNVKKGDLVFLDPPYTVSHNLNGFVRYNQKLFSIEDQYRLADSIKKIKNIGAYYILTNAAHKKVKEIFNNGDRIIEVKRASVIGGKNAERGKFAEIVVTNI